MDVEEEGKETKVAWQACGSNDIPKEMESTAPKGKQENEQDRESRYDEMMATNRKIMELENDQGGPELLVFEGPGRVQDSRVHNEQRSTLGREGYGHDI